MKNENGQTIYNQKYYLSKGTTVKQVTVPNPFKGVYFVQAMLDNEIVQVKFLKQ